MVLEPSLVTSKQKKTEMVLILSNTTENCKKNVTFYILDFSPENKFQRTLNYLTVLSP